MNYYIEPSSLSAFYLAILFCLTFGLLIWGLCKRERIYQYPFIVGGVYASFILPQAISLFKNPQLPNNQALDRVFIMSFLCAIMAWIGYQFPVNRKWVDKLVFPVDEKKLLHGGIALISIAIICSYLIGSNRGDLTGTVTILKFFRSLIFPGFAIALLSTLKKFNFINFSLTVIASIVPLQIIVLDGKRESTVIFIITFALCLYYVYRQLPPRAFAVFAVILALFIIPLVSDYRHIVRNNDWEKITTLSPGTSLSHHINEGETLELRNAAYIMDYAIRTNKFNYGRGWWDQVVFNFVPAQIIGRKIKESLTLGTSYGVVNGYLFHFYRYKQPSGSTPTGIADTFVEFDYFGCLVFAFIAYIFKTLWTSATVKNSLFAQIMYIHLFSSAIITITHGTTRFTSYLIIGIVFLGSIFIYARQPNISYWQAKQKQ